MSFYTPTKIYCLFQPKKQKKKEFTKQIITFFQVFVKFLNIFKIISNIITEKKTQLKYTKNILKKYNEENNIQYNKILMKVKSFKTNI